MWGWLFCVAAVAAFAEVAAAGAGAARLVCYAESGRTDGFSECTHLVYAGDARGEKLDAVLKQYRKSNPRLKIILRVSEVDKDLRTLLKSKHVQGLEIHDAHKSLNKTQVLEIIESARSAIASSGGGPLFLALPAHPELLAKYYDLRTLVKKVDLMMVQTHALGLVKKMTYHPSRLSGLWDMMNTDSVVDLAVGLGIPASKLVISLPATVRQFTLLNETLSTPGSPTLEDEPKETDQSELCRQLQKGRWTLERDQDLSAPYAFKDKTWMSFEDSSSVDVKGKYARVRGLAGLALHNADRDVDTPCGPTLRTSLAKVLNQQSRAPRAAVLRSLEHEILSAPGRVLDALQVSPYRITQIVDSDGVIHSIREDMRTEFSCSRQGYFVHPRSCARFYRCVKFDQLSPEYTVFEFDCPAGLAFDSRYEVCVWPGSLPHSQACPGSSEIAPVPQTRFICPEHEGYYADPENCRWFFACLDHGKAPLTAYEFRCPFGLGFDAGQLKCDWPWLVPACGNIARYEAEVHGYSGAALTGAAGFHGQTANDINIAGHQSLVSGASLNNLVGIQSGFLSQGDSLDSNFIASQELANGGYNQVYQDGRGLESQVLDSNNGGVGLVQPTKYTSGSIILDDYRLPTKEEAARHGHGGSLGLNLNQNQGQYSNSYNGYNAGHTKQQHQFQGNDYEGDNSGSYIHDPSGDYAEPYKHVGSPVSPYIHDDSGYKQSSDYYDIGRYSASQGYESNGGGYVHDSSGAYVESNANGYAGNTGYKAYSAYANDNSGQYIAGVYRTDGHIGDYDSDVGKASNAIKFQQYHGGYSTGNAGNYLSDSKAYTGVSHTLTAGAVNVGLVGKTTLVDTEYNDQNNYNGAIHGHTHAVLHQSYHNAHLPIISQPAVSINHVGTDQNNLDRYNFVTTPTSSGIPTTTTPFAVTTSLPVTTTYKTTFVPEAPKSNVKQIFGYTQPAVTFVQPTVVAIQEPKLHVTDYNQKVNYQVANSESSGYHYAKPSIKFEDGITYTTPAPVVVSTFKPQGFRHNQQTLHKVESHGYEYSTPVPISEEPFKKVVAYTTGSPVSFVQPASYTPQAFSHQTIHKVESNADAGYEYNKPTVSFEHTTATPVVSTYQPQVYNHQTFHKVDASQVNTGYNYEKPSSGYDYPKPVIKFEEARKTADQYTTPAPVVSTYKPQSYSHETYHNFETHYAPSTTVLPKIELTYHQPTVSVYKNPILKYTENVTPITYVHPTPQSYSHQTIHKVESNVYTPTIETGKYSTVDYETPKSYEYSTAQPAISTYAPHTFSHQTFHKVEAGKVNTYKADSGYKYEQPAIKFEDGLNTVQYSTPAPVVSTYQPQVFSHQTFHKVEVNKVNNYETGSGYQYEQPSIQFEDSPKIVQYSTPAPVVSTYKPQTFSHQTIHKVEAYKVNTDEADSGYHYKQPLIKLEEGPKIVQYTTPAPVISTYQPQVFSHQTFHKFEANKVNTYEGDTGYNYEQPAVKFEDGSKFIQYSTPAPVVSTYRPQAYSKQIIHKTETQQYVPSSTPLPKVTYEQPAVTVYENPIVKFTQTTSPVKPTATVYTQPIVHQHEVSHIVSQPVQYETSAQQSLELGQGYSYSQPEIQRDVETLNANAYSDATLVSHQVYHQSNEKNQYEIGEKAAFVSSTPATLAYEEHYAEYDSPKIVTYKAPEYIPPKIETYKAPEYIPPKGETYKAPEYIAAKVETYKAPEYVPPKVDNYNAPEYIPPKADLQSYTVSTPSTPVIYQSSLTHKAQDQYDDYNPQEYSQQYHTSNVQQISFGTYHIAEPKKVESYHISSYPGSTVTTKYNQLSFDSPEIQDGYKAVEYLPPVVSTVTPIVTSTYKPRTYSTIATTREYLPPSPQPDYNAPEYLPPQPEYKSRDYLPPKVENTYLPSTTAKPLIKSTTYSPTTTYKAPEYLPPLKEGPSVINFANFGYETDAGAKIEYNPYQEYTVSSTSVPVTRKQNIVIQTSKSNLLGFGTVGPDAGLVGSTTYTTAAPIISSTYAPLEVSSSATVRRTRPKYVKSTTQTPYIESTTAYKAPEYLPPSDDASNVNFESFGLKNFNVNAQIGNNPYKENVQYSAPIQRKQNLVVQTAKASLTYPTSAPVVSSETYSLSSKSVGSTYAPIKQELVEVSPVPVRRTKPKLAVVTKINDYNPLLVRKLGAVCSCQSPVLILKGKRPDVPVQQDFEDYSNDYEDSGRGDIGNYESARIQTPFKTVYTGRVTTSTFNPIIVPDDSFYQDYEPNESVEITPKTKQVYSENFVSSTISPVVSSTDKVLRIRPRVKAVTVAPTYQTVLLKQEVAPTVIVSGSQDSTIDAQTFDRYGPGGWRSRDETLQGTVDCKRAGLFRHPKQCNKFYACRWDCTKQRFTLHVFNCPVQLSFDPNIGACNWPSQGPACQGDTLLTNAL